MICSRSNLILSAFFQRIDFSHWSIIQQTFLLYELLQLSIDCTKRATAFQKSVTNFIPIFLYPSEPNLQELKLNLS
jgi:hypothetical protein